MLYGIVLSKEELPGAYKGFNIIFREAINFIDSILFAEVQVNCPSVKCCVYQRVLA